MRAQDGAHLRREVRTRAPSLVSTAGADHCASRELRLAAFAGGEGSVSSLVCRSRSMARALCTQSPVCQCHVIGTHESAHGSPSVSTPCHRTITRSCAPRLTSGRAIYVQQAQHLPAPRVERLLQYIFCQPNGTVPERRTVYQLTVPRSRSTLSDLEPKRKGVGSKSKVERACWRVETRMGA